jgi:excisionase family DNA binding protein
VSWSQSAARAWVRRGAVSGSSRMRSPPGLLLTVEEVARRLRIGRTLVYHLISSGDLESVKVGRLRRVPAECLPEYVAALRRTRNPEPGDGNAA